MKSLRLLASATLLATGVVAAAGAVGGAAAAATVKECTPSHVTVSLGTSQGTAGTIIYPIIFTNTGSSACAIWGVPAVQPVVGGAHHSRQHVGPAAHNNSIGEMPVRHTVKPGKSVSAAYGVAESGNYTASTCGAKTARAIVVSMGDVVHHAYVPLTISVCTKLASTHTQLIVAGTTGV
jgi:hypothetical protein